MKHIFLILVVLMIPALLSCEGGTTFTKRVHNQSGDTLVVITYSLYASDVPVTIVPGASQEVFWRDEMGRFVDDSYTCTLDLDSMRILVSGGKTLLSDPMDGDNWIRQSKDGRNSREDCTFTVTDEDLR